ncbi:carcinoembryonic antigen-related cell adhesion molecule 2-like [Mercenaria mercenaria]|uniref:carcinoembryonic antigen-related cell adhesion molecule 2-like n=1 Tax=Mercenaria mercenaria TaxID=6596 RepID=UPI00234F5519|nr:carcinoembryonic antigen-related cell adhesion molecule 2-like [Mercenaria mercenaria]
MSGLFVLMTFLFEVFMKVEGWQYVTPVGTVFSRVNSTANIHFSADLTGLNSPRTFFVKFYDGTTQTVIRYNADKSYSTDALPGVTITSDTAGNVVVSLENVQRSSAGTYIMDSPGLLVRCNCLYLLDTPTKPTLSVSNSPSVGGRVTLTCNSRSTTTPSNHSLSLAYKWTIDNVDNPSGPKYSYSANRNRLTLSNVEENDIDLQFTCSATENVSDGYTSNNSESLSFRTLYGPKNLDFRPNGTSYIGYEYTSLSAVTCKATCNPSCKFKWTKIGQVSAVSNISVLNLEMLTREEAGTYRCTAITQGGFSLAKDLTIHVSSFFVEGHEGMNNVTVDEHYADMQFSCIIDLNVSSTVKILFNGNILKETEDQHKRSLTFKLRTISCLQSGLYACESGDLNEQIIMSITLIVRCAPRPLRQIKQNITSSLNVPVRLSFTAIAYPEPGPAGFAWHKENAMRWMPLLSNEDLEISSLDLQTNLTILNVSRQDFGQYRVTVTNDIGRYEQFIFLKEEGSYDLDTKDCPNSTVLIVGVTLGIISASLAAYSVYLTIWFKKNMTNKGGSVYHQTRKEQTYANEVFIEDTKEPKPRRSDATDSQYTALDDTFKEQNVAYDILQTTKT